MLQFLKIYFRQLFKIFLAVAGAVWGLIIPLYIYGAQSYVLSKELLEALLLFFSIIGFLVGVLAPFLFEFRRRLSIRSFLGELLLMVIAFVFVSGGFILGIATGIRVGSSVVTSDGTGLAVMFFLLSGAIVGVIPGMILGALGISIWKLWSGGKTLAVCTERSIQSI